MIQIALIHRHPIFSPHCEANDAAILDAVAKALNVYGIKLKVFSEEGFCQHPAFYPFFLSMARDEKTLQLLNEFEGHGAIVVNSPKSVRNCLIKNQLPIFQQKNIPIPHTRLFKRKDYNLINTLDFATEKVWIKRADAHSLSANDVMCVAKNRLRKTIAHTDAKIISISENLEGDLIKCYGVTETGFFRRFYPQENAYSKFGMEAHNAPLSYHSFDEKKLSNTFFDAARLLGLNVFGADCIVLPNGDFRFIDFNDFPSFATFRYEAAEAITTFITHTIEKQ